MKELLINEVRARVFLYNPADPDYCNREKKRKAWQDIADSLSCSGINTRSEVDLFYCVRQLLMFLKCLIYIECISYWQ